MWGRKRMYLQAYEEASPAHKKLLEGHNQGKWYVETSAYNINDISAVYVRGGTSGVKYKVPLGGKVRCGRGLTFCVIVKGVQTPSDDLLTRVMMVKYKEKGFLQNSGESAESFSGGLRSTYLSLRVSYPLGGLTVAALLAFTLFIAADILVLEPNFAKQVNSPTKASLPGSRLLSAEEAQRVQIRSFTPKTARETATKVEKKK